jgi:hypothetical protein
MFSCRRKNCVGSRTEGATDLAGSVEDDREAPLTESQKTPTVLAEDKSSSIELELFDDRWLGGRRGMPFWERMIGLVVVDAGEVRRGVFASGGVCGGVFHGLIEEEEEEAEELRRKRGAECLMTGLMVERDGGEMAKRSEIPSMEVIG